MSWREQYTCDCGCGAVRGETNHWWLVDADEHSFRALPWNGAIAREHAHAAGEACMQRMLSRWMEKQRTALGEVNAVGSSEVQS